MVVGTPDYLSPEQIRGETAMETSDLYAVGVVAYELLTGRKPFAHEDLVPLLQMHLLTPPPPPTQFRPDLPPAVEAAILRLLQKSAADRFPTARAVADALSALRS
jgi:serine/threonine protein kinase